ncbi:MAG: CsgG/HfaB family protein [Alphaproteobacteria bacterium]
MLRQAIKKFTEISILFVLLLFCFLKTAHSEVIYVETNAKGSGENFEVALKKAFSRAVSKINGVNVESESVLKTIDKSVTTNDGSSASLTRDLQQTINEKTKGSIKTFEILNESTDINGIVNVEIKATIAKFALSKSAKRKRIAVVPFRLNVGRVDLQNFSPEDFRELLNQKFSTYLVQTRKFTVLDREFDEEIKGELSNLADSENIDDQVKIGQALFADYIVVGRVDNLEIKEVEKKFLTSDTVVKKTMGLLNFSYRIIDVPTTQIKYSSSVNLEVNLKKQNQPLVYLSDMTAHNAGVEVMYAIYPILVEKIEGDLLYLGQGGNQIKMNDQYSLYERSDEKIKDSYTGETLGNIETKVGLVEIVDTNSKFSVAKIIEVNVDLDGNFEPRKYMVKPFKTAKKLKQGEVNEEIKKKKKKIDETY